MLCVQQEQQQQPQRHSSLPAGRPRIPELYWIVATQAWTEGSMEPTCEFLVCACYSTRKCYLLISWVWAGAMTACWWAWLNHEIWPGFEGGQEWPLGSCSKFFHFRFTSKAAESSAQDRNETTVHLGAWLLLPMASYVNSQRSTPQSLAMLPFSAGRKMFARLEEHRTAGSLPLYPSHMAPRRNKNTCFI